MQTLPIPITSVRSDSREHGLLPFPRRGLCTHGAPDADPVLCREMGNNPSQMRGDGANAEILESLDIALLRRG